MARPPTTTWRRSSSTAMWSPSSRRCWGLSRSAASVRRGALCVERVPSRLAGTPGLELDLAGDAGDRAAADPDRAVVGLDVDAPDPSQRGALAGDVRGRGWAGAQEPLRQRRVQAAGHGVLDRRAVLGEEGAHLE